jgi:ATP-dependent Clp protease ATP-binding subunit ClpA
MHTATRVSRRAARAGILALARRASNPTGPGEGLAATAELRERLDEVERSHVERALAEGWSWTRIADCLGITRQAAHKRYAGRVSAEPAPQGASHRPTVGRAVAEVLRAAAAETRTMGHPEIDSCHLLIGMLTVDDGVASESLHSAGVSSARTRELVGRIAPASHLLAALVGSGEHDSTNSTGTELGPSSRKALRDALREAAASSSDSISNEHLLLALLRPCQAEVRRVLKNMGVQPDEFRDDLDGRINASRQ